MNILIGSCSESKYGVGTLFVWSDPEVDPEIKWDKEEGCWVVTAAGETVRCYDLKLLEVEGGIVEHSLEELQK